MQKSGTATTGSTREERFIGEKSGNIRGSIRNNPIHSRFPPSGSKFSRTEGEVEREIMAVGMRGITVKLKECDIVFGTSKYRYGRRSQHTIAFLPQLPTLIMVLAPVTP